MEKDFLRVAQEAFLRVVARQTGLRRAEVRHLHFNRVPSGYEIQADGGPRSLKAEIEVTRVGEEFKASVRLIVRPGGRLPGSDSVHACALAASELLEE